VAQAHNREISVEVLPRITGVISHRHLSILMRYPQTISANPATSERIAQLANRQLARKQKECKARGAVNRLERAAQLRLEQAVACFSDSPLFVPSLVTAPFCWRGSYSVTLKHELWIWFPLSYAMMKALLRLATVRDTKTGRGVERWHCTIYCLEFCAGYKEANGSIYRQITQIATCLLRCSSKHVAENSSWISQTTTRSRHFWRKELKQGFAGS